MLHKNIYSAQSYGSDRLHYIVSRAAKNGKIKNKCKIVKPESSALVEMQNERSRCIVKLVECSKHPGGNNPHLSQ